MRPTKLDRIFLAIAVAFSVAGLAAHHTPPASAAAPATRTLDDDTAEDLYNQAISASNDHDYDKAIDLYGRALKAQPNFTDAYFNRALAYYQKGQYDKSSADLTLVIQLRPKLADAYINRGMAAIKLQQTDQAIQDFTKALEIKPNCVEALSGRARLYNGKGQYDNAIADLKRLAAATATTANPAQKRTALIANLDLGDAYIGKEDYPNAVASYTAYLQAGAADPKATGSAYALRGVAYAAIAADATDSATAISNLDKAIADDDQAATLAPADPQPLFNKGSAQELKAKRLDQGQDHSATATAAIVAAYQQAIESLQKVLQMIPVTDPQAVKIKAHLTEVEARSKALQGGTAH